MSQSGYVLLGPCQVQIDLPDVGVEVLPGVRWGALDAFPTPAYWAYQVLARRMTFGPLRHRLGNTLPEEVAACLLGGHGIPAVVGIAAFHQLRDRGLCEGTPGEAELFEALQQPLRIDSRLIRYRFAAQKARYLHAAFFKLNTEQPPVATGRALRDWLLQTEGIGYKTASWIARNWLDADDVAILDVHVLRAGMLANFLDPSMNAGRHYCQLEEQFLCFSAALGVRASELDAVIWHEMMASPRTVARLVGDRTEIAATRIPFLRRRPTKERQPDTMQLSLVD